jgi:hypothetical protein
MNESSRVVALGISEVAEVKGRFDSRIGRGQVDAATRARARDVGCHAESIAVLDDGVSKTLGVEVEGNLVAVHHNVGCIAVVASGILGLTSKEDASIGVHGGLVSRNRLVQLPHDDSLGMIQKILADARDILDNRNVEGLELGLGSNTRVKEKSGSINSTSAQDSFLASVQSVLLARLEGNINTRSDIVLDNEL